MKDKKIKRLFLKFLGFILSIFVLVTTFSTILNVMSYQKLVTEIYKDSSLVSVKNCINNIKYAVSFGKPIEKFYGMDEVLNKALNLSSEFLSTGIIDREGKVLYDVGIELDSVPKDLISNEYVESDNGIYTKSIINEEAYLFLLLDKNYVSNSVKQYIKNIVIIDLYISIGIIVLSILVFIIIFYKNKKQITFSSLKISGILTLILSQLVMGIFVVNTYTNRYINSIEIIKGRVSATVKTDLEDILNKGIPLEEMSGMDEYFENLASEIPELDSIYLTNRKVGDSTTDKIVSGNRVYYINVNSHVDDKVIFSKIVDVSIDALVLMVMTVLLSLEISLFIGSDERKKRKLDSRMNLPGIRLFFFVIELTLSLDAGFISIVSYNLFKGLNMVRNLQLLSGLPVTLGIISVILGILFWGKIIFKMGMKNSIIYGTACCSLGLVLSALSSTFVLLCIARFIYGFGMASILSVTKICVSIQDDIKQRAKFSSILSVGMLVGSSCGIVIGGLLADRMSYKFVFLLAGILSMLSLFLIPITNINNSMDNVKIFSFKEVKRIITSPLALLFIVLVLIPIYISSMFVSYSIPLFGNEINLSQTIISAMIMINYIITAYLTAPISKIFFKKFGIKSSIFVYELTLFFVIAAFCLINILFPSLGVIAAIISVILLAIADSFGLIVLGESLNTDYMNGVSRTTSSLVIILVGKLGTGIAPTLISLGLSNGVVMATSIIPLILLFSFIVSALIYRLVKIKGTFN